MGDGPVNGVFTHEGLAGSCRSAHHNGMPLIEGINRLQLEVIQREGKELRRIRRSHTGGLCSLGVLILHGGILGTLSP